ncbi:hypothetical protein B0H13DRAFT_2026560 [Mycena leptocephala]|nr:hypothetical protein B0H13DRAFT_2026560 [Mycena leptocephala]
MDDLDENSIAEYQALLHFYGAGVKTCAVTRRTNEVELSPQLPYCSASPERLQWMLSRKLREDRYTDPEHACAIRENVIPLAVELHNAMKNRLPSAILIVHEDILARTYAYELEVKVLRKQWIKDGKGDPGRPPYAHGYPTLSAAQLDPEGTLSVREQPNAWGPVTQHRLHLSQHLFQACIHRNPLYSLVSQLIPGDRDVATGVPKKPSDLLTIDTLLSIPFCHPQHPPIDILLSNEIQFLWSWDPAPASDVFASSETPEWPVPIFHPSRHATTFDSLPFPLRVYTIMVPERPPGTTTASEHHP